MGAKPISEFFRRFEMTDEEKKACEQFDSIVKRYLATKHRDLYNPYHNALLARNEAEVAWLARCWRILTGKEAR